MSAQNSCSDSESSRRRSTLPIEASGYRASYAIGARSCGSSASSSSRIVVPVRGGPTTNSGADTAVAAIAGVDFHASCSRSHVWSTRRTSLRVEHAAEQVQPGLGVDRREHPLVGVGPTRPLALAEVVEAGRRARDGDELRGVETDDRARVAHRVAEEVEPPDPVGMRQGFHGAHPTTLSQGCAKIGRRNCRLGNDVRGHGVAIRPQPDPAVLRRARARRPAARDRVVGNDRRAVVRARSVRRRDGCNGLRGRSRLLAGRTAHRDRHQLRRDAGGRPDPRRHVVESRRQGVGLHARPLDARVRRAARPRSPRVAHAGRRSLGSTRLRPRPHRSEHHRRDATHRQRLRTVRWGCRATVVALRVPLVGAAAARRGVGQHAPHAARRRHLARPHLRRRRREATARRVCVQAHRRVARRQGGAAVRDGRLDRRRLHVVATSPPRPVMGRAEDGRARRHARAHRRRRRERPVLLVAGARREQRRHRCGCARGLRAGRSARERGCVRRLGLVAAHERAAGPARARPRRSHGARRCAGAQARGRPRECRDRRSASRASSSPTRRATAWCSTVST